jgi:hypothetical protein
VLGWFFGATAVAFLVFIGIVSIHYLLGWW